MNNINWKVRISNGSWWLSVISAIVIAIFSILRLCGVETSVSEEEIINVIILILMVPASIGIITDPTTKGIADSQRAMSYKRPYSDSNEEKGGPSTITFDEFCKKYKINHSYGFEGTYVGECVSLVKNYIRDVLGVRPKNAGNAKDYWLNRNTAYIKSLFTAIPNTPEFIPKKGDVFVRTSGPFGHIGIVISATKDYFYTIEQNYKGNGKVKNIKHTDWSDINFLRPKNQSGISSNTSHSSHFIKSVAWKNGSTIEKVFEACNLTGNIGSISPREGAKCYGKKSKGYVVVYKINGSSKHKVGFVKYAGGVKSIPSGGKHYKNGSTIEKVYSDTAKKNLIGNLDKNESCMCLGIVDGMYLVLYKINGSSNCKIGFVSYNGGIK